MNAKRIFTALTGIGAISLASVSFAFENTAQSDFSGEGSFYTDVATDGSLWLAVGLDGRVASSTDGSNWTTSDIGSSTDLYAVAAGEAGFLIGGEDGHVYSTLDGQVFSEIEVETEDDIDTVVTAQGSWHLVTVTGLYLSSEDGVSWMVENENDNQLVLDLAADGDVLYALTAESSASGENGVEIESELMKSASAEAGWSTIEIEGEATALFGADGAVFVKVEKETGNGIEESLVRLNGNAGLELISRISISLGGLELVLDGSASAGIFSQSSEDAALMGNRLVLVGSAQAESHSMVSIDALGNAEAEGATDVSIMSGITSSDDMIVAVGANGTIMTSFDGSNWSEADADDEAIVISEVSFDGNWFIAVGADKTAETGIVYSSADAEQWTEIAIKDMTAVNGSTEFDGSIILVGESSEGSAGVEVSADGSSTTEASVPSSAGVLHTVIAIDGKLIAAGENQTILTSSNGTVWSEASVSGQGSATINALAELNGTWIAVGEDGFAAVSVDGDTWTQVDAMIDADVHAAVAYEGAFYIAGENGTLATSVDGSNWTMVETGTGADFTSAVDIYGEFVLISEDGRTFVTTDFESFVQASGSKSTRVSSAAFGNGHLVTAGDSNAAVEVENALWLAAVRVSASWKFSVWFGYLLTLNNGEGWNYSPEHGWIFVKKTKWGGLFTYSVRLESWTYTSFRIYPNVYIFKDDIGWTYYLRNTGSWYYDFSTESWLNFSQG